MSPRARRFFGCIVPLAFALAGCGVFLMVGYAGQVALSLDGVGDQSMQPLLKPGMTVLTNNTAFWYEEPYRPGIASVRSPEGRVFRRIVGLPGETIEVRGNEVLANGEMVVRYSQGKDFGSTGPLTLGPDEYFVLAQEPSYPDSRSWGPLKRDAVFGIATFYRTAADGGWQPVVTPEPRGNRR